MTYTETLQYLYQTLPMYQRVGAAAYKADLTNTYKLCEALDNPQERFKSIHIGGTNGKGSTSHMLAAILNCAGYKTGLYTSPHLREFTERIRINGQEVDRSFVVGFVERLKPVFAEVQPSFFEMTVAMAFEYFAKEKVDIAVVEVGLGGRLDSTNVITPELSLITNISFDHKDLLGDTLEKIAVEKAGIIKEGIPVVISERQAETEEVFIRRAAQMNAQLGFASDRIKLQPGAAGLEVYREGAPWLKGLVSGLKGSYQMKNIPGILEAVWQLRSRAFAIPDGAVHEGIRDVVKNTGLKGRWQVLQANPLMICDTGHNAAGIAEVLKQLLPIPHRVLHFVLGMVKDKDIADVLSQLPVSATYYFCQASIPRALAADQLALAASKHGLRGKVIADVNLAIRTALQQAASDDLIFVGGSTYVVAEIDGL